MADLKKKFMEMKVADLRRELDSLGLEKTGVKNILVERLIKHYEATFRANLEKNKMKEQEVEDTAKDDVGDSSEANTGSGTDIQKDIAVDEVLDVSDDVQTSENTSDANKEDAGKDATDCSPDSGTGTEVAKDVIVDEVLEATDTAEAKDKPVEADATVETEENASNKEEVGDDVHVVEVEQIEEEDKEKSSNLDADVEDISEETEGDIITQEQQDDSNVQDEEEKESDTLDISVGENDVIAMNPEDNKEEETDLEIKIREPDSLMENPDEASKDNEDKSNISSATKKEAEKHNSTAEDTEDNSSRDREAERERLTILVTGLSSDTTANDLKSFFRQYGKIGRIKIMTNTRVPGSQRFAHVCASNMDDLNFFIENLNGLTIKGKTIRLIKAPEDGSVAKSYEIAVATELEADAAAETSKNEKNAGETNSGNTEENEIDSKKDDKPKTAEGNDAPNDSQASQESPPKKGKPVMEEQTEKKGDVEAKKKETAGEKEGTGTGTTGKESPAKGSRSEKPHHQRSRKDHRGGRRMDEHSRPPNRNPRSFRRGGGRDGGDFRRHPGHVSNRPIEKVHRDRPPMGRGQGSNNGGSGRRSPHAKLTFDQIREIRDEQRRRDIERRRREEERDRAVEVDRQKRLEYQNYMEFKNLEREREKLRMERERIEREKLELIKLERERQKAERDRIEKEKEELRRAKMNIEQTRRAPVAVKRPYEDDRVRRDSADKRRKSYSNDRMRMDVGKTEAERKMEKERYERERIELPSTSGRSRSPANHESRRDVWARDSLDMEVRSPRNRSDERVHRRDSGSLKRVDRRGVEAPGRIAAAVSEPNSRYVVESPHSSSRGSSSLSKRPTDRYEDSRSSGRESEWIQRSTYMSSGSGTLASLPSASSSSAVRDSWPLTERKIEAWDTSRLQPRTEPWISGGVGAGATGGRSSLPAIPPPPIYSHAATSLNLQGSLGLGGYSSGSDRYEGYKGPFHHLRRF